VVVGGGGWWYRPVFYLVYLQPAVIVLTVGVILLLWLASAMCCTGVDKQIHRSPLGGLIGGALLCGAFRRLLGIGRDGWDVMHDRVLQIGAASFAAGGFWLVRLGVYGGFLGRERRRGFGRGDIDH
jgi:hypothetical protein